MQRSDAGRRRNSEIPRKRLVENRKQVQNSVMYNAVHHGGSFGSLTTTQRMSPEDLQGANLEKNLKNCDESTASQPSPNKF